MANDEIRITNGDFRYNLSMFIADEKSRWYGRTPDLSIEKLRECFADPALKEVNYAVLFGSRAVGKVTPQSDYDLAVYGEGEFPWGVQSLVWDVMTRRCGLADCDLDVVDLRSAGEVLLGSVTEAYVMLKGEKDGFSRLLAELRGDCRDGRVSAGGAGGDR